MTNPMNNKKTAYALFLSILVVLIYTELVIAPMRPQEAQAPAVGQAQATTTPAGSAAPSTPQAVSYQAPAAQATDTTTPAAPVVPASIESIEEALKNSPTITIKSGSSVSKVSLLGGRLVSHLLGDFKKELKGEARVDLVNPARGNYPLGFSIGGESDVTTSYAVVAASSPSTGSESEYQVPEGGDLTLTLSGTLPNGAAITKLLRFGSSGYQISVDVQVANSPTTTGQPGWLEWTESLSAVGMDQYNPSQFIRLNAEGAIDRVVPNTMTLPLEQVSKWVAFSDNYFASTLISEAATAFV
jgi:YidC/Oxa1 family membrane protein insertase